MTAISWVNGFGGDWADFTKWSQGGPPGILDDVTIAQGNTSPITITNSVGAHSLALTTAYSTVVDTGALHLASSLTVGPGTFILGIGGSVIGGTIIDAASGFKAQGGTLDGVAYQGALDLSASGVTLNVVDGIAFSAVGGGGKAVVNLTGASTLQATGVETFDNATVQFGGGQNGISRLYANDSLAKGGGVLTLGANFTVQQDTGRTQIYSSGLATDGVINQGVINAAANGGTMNIASTFFTNAGTVTASNGEALEIAAPTFTNAQSGHLNVTGGATLTIDGTGSWSNAGVISETGATLNLGGIFTTAGLGVVTRSGGVINITGVLDNSGATLAFGPGTPLGAVNLAGTIHNGVIQSGAGGLSGAFTGAGGVLDGVTYQGVLDVTAAQSLMTIVNGISFSGAGGAGAATINLTGPAASLVTKGQETLDNATLNIGAAGPTAVLLTADTYNTGAVTTLGAGFVVQQVGAHAALEAAAFASDGYLNQGAIKAGVAGGALTLMSRQSPGAGGLFTNAGSIVASNGDTVEIGASTFANTASGVVSATTGAVVTIDGTGAWSNAGVIGETGATLNLGGNFTTAGLGTVTRSGGTINLTGVLDNTGATAAFGAGSAIGAVNLSGTVKHGVIVNGAGGLSGAGGVLDGVAYQGAIDLTAAQSQLTIVNGITLAGAGGTGPGTINLTGAGATLIAKGSEGVDNATVNIGSASGGPAQIFLADVYGTGAQLTLGPNLILQQTGAHAQMEGGDLAGDVTINQGTINAGFAGGTLTLGVRQYVPGGVFTNAGAITVTNGEAVEIGQTTFHNTGTITVGVGSSLVIDGTGSWTNTGTITDTGGALTLGGAFTNASLLGISRSGGSATLSGTLDNTGGVFAVGTGTALGSLSFSGTIAGGVVTDPGGGLVFNGGTLSGVSYQGVLDLSGYAASAFVSNGIALTGAGGAGPGLVKLTGFNAGLAVKGDGTLDNATIQIGAGNTAYLVNYGTQPGGSTLTLGANLAIVQTGAYAGIAGTSGVGDNVVNYGTITAALAGGSFIINPLKFTNSGALIVGAGETLDLRAAHLSNVAGSTLSGGSYQAGGGGFIQLADNTVITTLQADVTETGAAAAVRANVGGVQKTLDSTLTTIGAGGALRLLGGRTLSTSTPLAVAGILQLGGGTVSVGSLTQAATGLIQGYGQVSGAVSAGGLIEAQGGTLKVNGAVTGAGHFQIDAGATLELGSATPDSLGVTFAGSNGVLAIDTPAAFSGVITGFGATEAIDLVNTTATKAVLNGQTMVVTLSGGGTQSYTLANPLPGVLLKTASDGHGGTLITDLYSDNFATAQVRPLAFQNNTPTTVDFGNQRIGATLTEALWVTNTATAPAENLDASVVGFTGAATGVGSVTQLTPGASNTTALKVSLNAANAGVQSGTVTIGLASDGTGPGGGNGVGSTPLASQSFNVKATLFRLANGVVAPTPSNVIVHVGDVLTETLSVTNAVAADGYSESLDALVFGASGAVSASGAIHQLAAGATDQSGVTVTVSTANAGLVSGAVQLLMESDGAGTSGFAATSTVVDTVGVSAQVDNYAQAAFKAGSGGTLTKTGTNSYTLDLGPVAQGATGVSATFGVTNAAAGLADLLSGGFVNSGSSALTVTGLGAFSGLGAGQTDSALKVALSTVNAGTFSDTLTLTNLTGSNASGFSQALGDITLIIIGKVQGPGQATLNTPQPVAFGNHHVGDVVTPQALSVTNSAPNTGTSLALDAGFGALPFGVTGSGAISKLAPGATDTSSLKLGLSTLISGQVSGAATVTFASDDGVSQTPLPSQTVSVTGGVYAYANPLLPSTLNLGATRVGMALNGAAILANGAFPDAYQEGLDYAVGGAPTGFGLTGAAGGAIASGKTAALGVTLAGTTAGAFVGNLTVGLTSDGAAVDGLAVTPLASQAVAVSGKVYAPAVAQLGATQINFGNIHVGDTVSQALQIANTATGGLTDSLVSGFSPVTGGSGVFAMTGSLGPTGIAAGASGALTATFSSASAGQFTGTAALSLASHDLDLTDVAVSAPAVTLTGKAYALAKPTVTGSTTLNFGAVRYGANIGSAQILLSNGGATAAYQERLSYNLGVLPAGFTVTGGASGTVASGASKSLLIAMNAFAPGDYTGKSATLTLASTGVGTSGLADTALSSQTISLSGKVYKTASAKLSATTLNFGTVHAGDVVGAKSLNVTNTASGALTDTLLGGFAPLTGPFSAPSTLGAGLAAGATGSLAVTLNTSTAGVFSVITPLALTSHDADLADVAVNAAPVTLTATVDAYAAAAFKQVGGAGTLSSQGANFVLDLGTIAQNGGVMSAQVAAFNSASGQSDLLSGVFTKTGSAAFTNTNLTSFTGLAAGQSTGPITVSLASTTWGTFTETVKLAATGSNASGYKGALAPETLTITGTVLAPKGSYTLTSGKDVITAANNADTVTAAANTLTATDAIDGGAGANALVLTGGGQFDLRAPVKLTNIQMLNVMEGQVTASPATNHQQVVYLRNGLDLAVNVAPDAHPIQGLQTPASVVIHGAVNNDVITLGSGADTVYLGAAGESVVGGTGVGTVIATAAVAGASVKGGANGLTLEITDGGAAGLNAADANLTVQLDKATTLTVNGGVGLTIGGDATVKNTLVGATANLDKVAVQNFATGNETLDLTDLGFGAGTTIGFAANAGGTGGVLSLGDGVHSAAVTLFGQFVAAGFHSASDGAGGTLISYVPPMPGGAMAIASPLGH